MARVDRVWGGVEGGGTKFHCLLGSGATESEIIDEETIRTTTPPETLEAVASFFEHHSQRYAITGLGVACFGPIDLDPASPHFGSITTTPKPGWSQCDVVGFLRSRLNVPVAWETDVNGALIAEHRWGAAQGLQSAVYFTVGTGIGGGALVNGQPLHGVMHPEMGHIPVALSIDGGAVAQPAPEGVCPYHGGGCLEGVASGPALAQRAGRPPATIPPNDPIWEEEAHYLAYAAVVATLLLSPQRIILGGGVMLNQDHLFPKIHTQFLSLLNGYIQHPAIIGDVKHYIQAPTLGYRAGALGAMALAMTGGGA